MNTTSIITNNKYKKLVKQNRENELKILYDQFWKMFNPDKIIISNLFLMRIENKHYKSKTMNELVNVIQWFNNNYDDRYMIDIGCTCRYDIMDKSRNIFCQYLYKRGAIYLIKDMSDWLMNKLAEKGLYNEELHKPVTTEEYYFILSGEYVPEWNPIEPEAIHGSKTKDRFAYIFKGETHICY